MPDIARPTNVRYLVLATTAIVAVFMYIDRVCLAQVKGDIVKELQLSPIQADWVLSAFFWSYALGQVPAGVLSARFGFRRVLAVYLFLWSLFTAVTGLTNGFVVLIISRLMVGLAEAGSYPTAAALVKGWFPESRRGFANSMVALGGRIGGALGQLITPVLVLSFAAYTLTVHGAVGGPAAAFGYDAHCTGWRHTLVLFGGLGMVWAVVFYCVVRDSPSEHPRANAAEAGLVGPPLPKVTRFEFPLALLAGSRNMWLSGMTQAGINIGWVFLITSLPTYLKEVHGVTGEANGRMAAVPALVGCVGMFFGGFLTDALTRRIGRRWGRSLPIGVSLFICGLAYATCIWATAPWPVIIAMCVMTIFVDLGVPSIWAFGQDVGGRHTGAAIGWGNMWGNVGAAVSPLLLGWVQRNSDWPTMFGTCAASFLVAACTALLLDATQPLEPTTDDGASKNA